MNIVFSFLSCLILFILSKKFFSLCLCASVAILMKVLVIDNFDSFTYNLVQFLGELGAELQVFRNNAISPSEIRERSPDGIVISPGPGVPDNSGLTLSVIKEFAKS
jgi:anthranilate/para-aminobenzoate synthase component II